MKRRLSSLLLVLCLLASLPFAALAREETEDPVTALCVSASGGSAFLDEAELQLLCRKATGRDLESVTFSQLPASVGTLTVKGEKLTPDAVCYMYQRPLLSQVCFTPYVYGSRRFTGQAELSFTMTSERGESVPGVLILHVPQEVGPYEEEDRMHQTSTAAAGEPLPLLDLLPEKVWFRSRSVSGASSYASNFDGSYSVGEVLTSAVFTLPSTDQGSLWLDHGWSTARKLLPEEVLYPDREPNFYNVTFVPANRQSATVRLEYTASCSRKKNVSGSLTLTLVGQTSPTSPTRPDSKPAPVEAVPAAVSVNTAQTGLADALYQACAARKLGDLRTVAFDTLPSPKEGTVLSADLPVTAGTAYPYGALAFLPGESFQGGLTLRYVGTDSTNHTFPGSLTLSLDYPPEGRFQDLEGWEWAAFAVQFLDLQKAVPYTRSQPSFRPGDSATRLELACALVRTAYPTADPVAATGFDLPDDLDQANAVAIAISRGLLRGDGEKRLFLDSQVTRQDALVMLHRALTDLGRSLPPAGDLSPFSDADALSPYARDAASALLAADILRGNGSGSLNPLSPITRAEMACLLYRSFS